MPRMTLVIVLLILSAIGGVVAARTLRRTTPQQQPVEFVRVFADRHPDDRPPDRETSQCVLRVRITNNEDEAVRVTGFRKTCDCTSIVPETLTVEPGTHADVSVTIDIPAAKGKRTAGGDYEFHAPVAPEIEWRGETRRLPAVVLGGKLRSVVEELPEWMELGGKYEGEAKELRHTLDLKCDKSVSGVSTTSDNPVIAAKASFTDPGTFALTVTARPTELGHFRGLVTLRFSGSDGKPLTRREIRVRGYLTPELDADPPMLHFGPVDAGATATGQLTLFTHSGKQFAVKSVTPKGDDVRVRDVGGGVYEFTVTASGGGPKQTHADVVGEIAGRPARTRINLEYVGVNLKN